jgi:glycosyltransferase involved in cell wall biosynthesis
MQSRNKRLALDSVPSKRRPKVSVLLITYNHGKYIAQAIESVLMQKTTFPVVINVIDDCSTDGSAEIVMDYAARYPGRVVACLNRKNIGSKVTQKNFAKGFATLDGEYWTLLEGDDYWTSPDKLQRQVDFLEANPDFVICAHNTVKVYEDGSREPHRFLYSGKKEDCDVYDAILLRTFFHTTGVLYRNVFEGVPPRGYDNRWSCDIYIYISHAAHGKIHHIDADMAVYRAHGSGLFSTMSDLDMWKYNIGGLQRYNAWLNFRFNRIFAEGIAKFCTHLLTEAGKNGVAPLTRFSRLKYNAIRAFYRFIVQLTDIRLLVHRRIRANSLRSGDDRAFGEPSKMTGLSLLALSAIERILKADLSPERLPNIRSFGPQPVEQGVAFNVQPDGQSSIWMHTDASLPHQSIIVFGGRALATSVKHDSLTGLVPPSLTESAGLVPVWIEALQSDGLHVSEPVFFDIRPRPQESRIPAIKDFGPQPVEAGQPFNVQSDGRSAVWIKLDSPPPLAFQLLFGGVALAAHAEGDLVTAIVPAELTAEAGDIAIQIRSVGGQKPESGGVVFEVQPQSTPSNVGAPETEAFERPEAAATGPLNVHSDDLDEA